MLKKIIGIVYCFVSLHLFLAPPADASFEFESQHSDQSYVFLLMEDDVKVNTDWTLVRNVRRQIKILKDDAKSLGEAPIVYDNKRDSIVAQKGITITPDGKRHPAVKYHDIARYDGEPMYSDAMMRIFSMPAVSVGSVLELSYTIVSKGLAMKNAFWDMQTLRQRIPVQEYRYSITFPEKLGIRYREFGLTNKPEITKENGWVTYRWVLSDLYDSEQEESYAPPPSPEDPMEAFEFSSINSWNDFAQWYAGLIDKNTSLTSALDYAARKAGRGKDHVRDKVRSVLGYIQDNFRYVSMSFGENVFEPHPTDQVFANKYGDCKDLSLLARAMLQSVGVKAHLALFNNEWASNDPAYDLPIPSLFDHVLLYVEDPAEGDFYADPLLKGYDIGEFPMFFQRAYTLVINDGGGVFRRLPEFDSERSAERSQTVVNMDHDWGGVFAISKTWDLDRSIQMRDRIKAMNDMDKKAFFEQLDFQLAQGGKVIKRELDGLDRRYGRLCSQVIFQRPDEFPSADGLIVIDLEVMSRDEAFEKKERRQSFYFAKNRLIENSTVYRIPEGFAILHMPQDLNIDGSNIAFTRKFTQTDRAVTVREVVREKREVLPKQALNDLRVFYADLARQTRQRIVLKKL